jgi:uncharacterized DUF497 family protein
VRSIVLPPHPHQLSITRFDPDHSGEEDRVLLLGCSHAGRLVVVAYTDRRDTVRIMSARLATRRERKTYASD